MAQAAPGPAPGLLETTTLPDLNSLPLFQYSDDGYNYQDIPPEEDNGPRKIINYVFSQDKWVGQPNVQELDPVLDTYTLNGADISVQAILSQNLEDRPCEICLEQEEHCRGEECRTSLREHFDEVEADYIRIGTAPGMGYGVFATGEIPTKTIVGEYLGEIVPNTDSLADGQHEYSIDVRSVGIVSAKPYGNWIRFVNHHCVNQNVIPRRIMCGKRMIMSYISRRDIQPNEELLSCYGRDYFKNLQIRCKCDWKSGAHLPPHNKDFLAAREEYWKREAEDNEPSGGEDKMVWAPGGYEVPLTTIDTLRGMQRTRAWGDRPSRRDPNFLHVRLDLRVTSDAA